MWVLCKHPYFNFFFIFIFTKRPIILLCNVFIPSFIVTTEKRDQGYPPTTTYYKCSCFPQQHKNRVHAVSHRCLS